MKTKTPLYYLWSFIFYLLLSPMPLALSQIPQGFNYQAIARDGTGAVLQNTPLQAMMYIQSESTGGTIFWKELHSTITTNDFGLFTLVVGTGTRQTESTVATFNLIDWSVAPKYLKTEIYYSGSWKDMGTSQLWSVPYALKSKESEQWTTSGSNIYRATGAVGIGTSTPQFLLEVDGGVLLRNPVSTGYQTLRLYNDINNDHRSLEIDYMGSAYASGEMGSISTTGAYPLYFGTSNTPRIFITSGGNVGIGTTTPISRLTVNGSTSGVTTTGTAAHSAQFQARAGSTAQGQRAVYSFYPTFEATPTDNVVRRAADIVGGYNGGAWGSEYLSFNVGNNGAANDAGNITSEKMRITSNGNVGIGTTNPTSRMVVQPSASWDDNTPLFEVKNKTGVPIFAVYNNGVRILIDHSESKGIKSGFAVGGYDMTKAGKTVDFMLISPDSIRFNINNDNAKALIGGFAVGG
jgi:hypothetical protein